MLKDLRFPEGVGTKDSQLTAFLRARLAQVTVGDGWPAGRSRSGPSLHPQRVTTLQLLLFRDLEKSRL